METEKYLFWPGSPKPLGLVCSRRIAAGKPRYVFLLADNDAKKKSTSNQHALSKHARMFSSLSAEKQRKKDVDMTRTTSRGDYYGLKMTVSDSVYRDTARYPEASCYAKQKLRKAKTAGTADELLEMQPQTKLVPF